MIGLDENNVVEVFSGTLWEAQLISSMLKDEGIESFLKNSVLTSYAYNPSFSQEVKIMILKSNLNTAERIIRGYKDKIN